MGNKAKVSGHSGLPEEVELRMLAEKEEALRRKKEMMFSELLAVMKKYGIAPNRRRETVIQFAKWMEGIK